MLRGLMARSVAKPCAIGKWRVISRTIAARDRRRCGNHAVLAGAFCGVQSLIGDADEVAGMRDARFDHSHTQADSHPLVLPGVFGDSSAHALGKLHCVRETRIREQNGELFTTIADHDVRLSHGLAEKLADAPEHGVAGLMPIPVIALLEVVDIRQDHGERAIAPFCLGEVGIQLMVKGAAVAQAGQAIGGGELLELVIRAFELCFLGKLRGDVQGDTGEHLHSLCVGVTELQCAKMLDDAIFSGDLRLHNKRCVTRKRELIVTPELVSHLGGQYIAVGEPDPVRCADAVVLSEGEL